MIYINKIPLEESENEQFQFYNPTRIIFGEGSIAKLQELIPIQSRVLMLYGGGSIKKNGVYQQVTDALREHELFEFGGIEPNPEYTTLMKAVQLVRENQIDFLLAVGGGSVIDGTKFVAAAALYQGEDPWDIVGQGLGPGLKEVLTVGTVLTLPATSSEMNNKGVISYREGAKILYQRQDIPKVFHPGSPNRHSTASKFEMVWSMPTFMSLNST